MNLLNDFKAFISRENLFQRKDKLLLAVSGGVDSVALCELCKQAGYDFVIAHCNFQLRGNESERDENFVKALGEKYNAPVFTKRFDTEEYSRQHKCSIQVAARELRYSWFAELTSNLQLPTSNPQPFNSSPHGPTPILTAHHTDDNIETMLMNFFKGTGIAGLRGILPRQGNIVRPLLFATKEELKTFAEQNKLIWVEDSSNEQDKYSRNYVRHKLIPIINELYPQAASNLAGNLQRFREVEYLYRQSMEKIAKKLVQKKGEELHIPTLKLKNTNAAGAVLHELIHPLGFTPKQVEEILHLMDSPSGRYIASPTHRILKNRNWLIIAPNETTAVRHVQIGEGEEHVEFAMGSLRLKELNNQHPAVAEGLPQAKPISNFHPSTSSIAFLDASTISFPLLLRQWKPGDYFYPLGMRKKKKLARFFIDQKLSATDKEKVWVLESGKKILWVIGLRIDDRFRLTESTKKILRVEWTGISY